jgi:PAS domain S-box-containing protein
MSKAGDIGAPPEGEITPSGTAFAGEGTTRVALRLRALLRMLQDIRDEANVDTVLERLCSLTNEMLGWSKVVVTLRDEAGQQLRPAASAGLTAGELDQICAVARSGPGLDSWRDERFRVGRAYFFDHRIDGGLSAEPYFVRTESGDQGGESWHPDDSLVVPIEAQDTRFGALIVDAPAHGRRPTRAEIEELQIIADHAASAVASFRLQERLRSTAREAEALYRASSLLVDTTDVDRLLAKILDAIDEHFGHPISTIYLREHESDVFTLRAFRGEQPDGGERVSIADDSGIVSRAARTGEVANVPDVELDPDYVVAIATTASELAVPLRIAGRVIGIINIESPVRSAFTPSDERVLASFAEHAAVALHAAQLYETVRDKARREAVVNSIISAVHSTRNLEEILRIPCVGLASALDVQRSYVAIIDWDTRVARIIHSYATEECELFTGEFPLALVPELSERLWRGEVVAVSDVFTDPVVANVRFSYERHHTRSIVYQPVVRQGDWHAALFVACDRVRTWTADELAFLNTVAEQVGTAFVQAELFERVVGAQRDWETTFDTMSDGVLLVDGERRIYGANAAAAALLGLDRDVLIGTACCDALAERPGATCPWHDAPGPGRVARQTVPWRVGRQTQVSVDPIADGSGAVIVLRDVSDLRMAEETARRQSAVVSQLASSATDPIAMLETDGTVLWVNEAMSEAAGVEAGAAAGRRFESFLAPDSRQTAAYEVARAIGGEPRFFETSIERPDGTGTWIFATLTPLLVETDLTGVLLVGRDITGHRRAAERAAEADKLRALGQLSSGVAHNFNNALSVILGRTQLLARRVDDPAVLKDLAIIEQVSHEAANTVRRIQNFARRRLQESFSTIDLRTLVADTVEMTATRWRVEASALGVRYGVAFRSGRGDLNVLGNDSELREVFVNVIFNALDAMPDGGDLAISVDRDGSFVVVRIADTGIGMDEEVQRRVFEPFFTTKGVQGTGLGLAVSYGIVSRHEGRIDVETAPGRGTVIRIALPAMAARSAAEGLARETGAAELAEAAAEILVVDDDASVLELISEALGVRGHAVRRASSGAKALELMRDRAASLVLTDLAMPGMNGIALSRSIRENWPAPRVVLMTGTDIDPTDLEGGAPSIDLTIGKPFELNELFSVLETLLAPAGRKGRRG